MPPKKGNKRAPRKGAKKGKKVAKARRPLRRTKNASEYASLSEVRTLTPGSGGFQTKNMYNLMDVQLADFTRATQVARAYQHYRIKYIKLIWKPTFDTFLTTTDPANVNTKHFVYYMIDKSGSLPTNVTLAGLKAMGAKPRALDEVPISTGWRPSVLTADMTVGGFAFAVQPTQYKISPWLNTNRNSVDPAIWNPSQVDHLGIYWYVDQLAGNAQPYTIDLEVQFEFKKPLLPAVGNNVAIPATVAELNASKDGIVDDRPGGDDTLLVH